MDKAAESLSRLELAAQQWEQLQGLIRHAWSESPFYRRKWTALGVAGPEAIGSLAEMGRLGFTDQGEIEQDQAEFPPWGSMTQAPHRFVAVHCHSFETGRPSLWYDDEPSWRWVKERWDLPLRAAGVGPGDRAFFACAFAPELWYWAGFERVQELGVLALTGGAMTPLQQVENLFALAATVLVAAPAEALALAQSAAAHGYRPALSRVRTIIYPAEPGLDLATTARALEPAWGADAFGLCWLTEAGLTGFECSAHPGGVHLLENDLLVEVVDPATGAALGPGAAGELVVTPLGRTAMPVIRYRTGSRVALDDSPCPCGRTLWRLAGGEAP